MITPRLEQPYGYRVENGRQPLPKDQLSWLDSDFDRCEAFYVRRAPKSGWEVTHAVRENSICFCSRKIGLDNQGPGGKSDSGVERGVVIGGKRLADQHNFEAIYHSL